jgi:hypothetical protein
VAAQVHSDETTNAIAELVGARAFTIGSHIGLSRRDLITNNQIIAAI